MCKCLLCEEPLTGSLVSLDGTIEKIEFLLDLVVFDVNRLRDCRICSACDLIITKILQFKRRAAGNHPEIYGGRKCHICLAESGNLQDSLTALNDIFCTCFPTLSSTISGTSICQFCEDGILKYYKFLMTCVNASPIDVVTIDDDKVLEVEPRKGRPLSTPRENDPTILGTVEDLLSPSIRILEEAREYVTREDILHLLRFGIEKWTFECQVCPKSYDTLTFLSDHMRAHQMEDYFCCWKCGLRTRYFSFLRAHFRWHGFVCFKLIQRKEPSPCSGQIEEPINFSSTLRPDENVQCQICSVRLETFQSFLIHLEMHRLEGFICLNCRTNKCKLLEFQRFIYKTTGVTCLYKIVPRLDNSTTSSDSVQEGSAKSSSDSFPTLETGDARSISPANIEVCGGSPKAPVLDAKKLLDYCSNCNFVFESPEDFTSHQCRGEDTPQPFGGKEFECIRCRCRFDVSEDFDNHECDQGTIEDLWLKEEVRVKNENGAEHDGKSCTPSLEQKSFAHNGFTDECSRCILTVDQMRGKSSSAKDNSSAQPDNTNETVPPTPTSGADIDAYAKLQLPVITSVRSVDPNSLDNDPTDGAYNHRNTSEVMQIDSDSDDEIAELIAPPAAAAVVEPEPIDLKSVKNGEKPKKVVILGDVVIKKAKNLRGNVQELRHSGSGEKGSQRVVPSNIGMNHETKENPVASRKEKSYRANHQRIDDDIQILDNDSDNDCVIISEENRWEKPKKTKHAPWKLSKCRQPPNAFLLFSWRLQDEIEKTYPNEFSSKRKWDICQETWKKGSMKDKWPFLEEAKLRRQIFIQQNPGFAKISDKSKTKKDRNSPSIGGSLEALSVTGSWHIDRILREIVLG